MNILDEALKIEEQGERLYRSFARDASDKGANYIFDWLADQEHKHHAIFQRMKEGGHVPDVKSADLKGVRDIFSGWKDVRPGLDIKTDQVELYRQALVVEEKSVALYEEGAHIAADEPARSVFLRIAAEEKAHQQIMENIIDLVTRPDFWAENAEFGYRGEDYYL
ncbi:MAG: ferritin family protein [Candidatus Omnitrophica bacterium]|nr:ferritin family protein [Candidatus Omnitrophota bacterium]